MGQRAFNYIATGILGLDSNDLKVYYDFNSGNQNHILSVPIGNPEYSGQILGNTGTFFGDLGSGNFYNNAVKIANGGDLFSKSATFIVTQEKTGTNNGVIFSCLYGDEFKSGYQFGINDANKFYFEYFNYPYPSIKTSLNTISDKNAWSVRLEENNVSFLYFNNNTLALEKESWSIDSTKLLSGNQWYIGSGQNQSPYGYYIDNFIYFDRAISDSNLNRLFSGIWNNGGEHTNSYLPYETGQITGSQYQQTGITGIISQTQSFSGYWTGITTREVYQYNVLTGNVASGEIYLSFIGNIPQYCSNREENPIYFENISSSAITGITGISKTLSGTDNVYATQPVYQSVYETGFTSTGQILVNLYNTGNGADLIFESSGVFTGDYSYLNKLGMNAVSNIGYSNVGFEVYVSSGQPKQNYFNKLASYNYSILDYSLDAIYPTGQVDVFLSGLINSTGGYAITGDLFYTDLQISGDYIISGRYLIFKDAVDPKSRVIYDIANSGDKRYFESGDYSSSGTLNINIYDNLFFLTGRKLISGQDYSGINGLFAPSQSIINTSGELRTIAFRLNQNQLFNYEEFYLDDLVSLTGFLSGTTGTPLNYELISGIYDGDGATTDYFSNSSGVYILESGIYPSGFYIDDSGINIFSGYTGWKLYSGTTTFDIRTGLNPIPPINGWENGTEFYVAYPTGEPNSKMTGQFFLRNTAISWLTGVRQYTDKFLEHSLSSDLYDGSKILNKGLTGFFIDNGDFWA